MLERDALHPPHQLRPPLLAAGQLRDRKLANLDRTRADLIAAGNIGCLTQLSGGAMPTVHTVELLDWMAGGPEPPAVATARAARAEA